MANLFELKRTLESRAQAVAEYLLPRGVREGREWSVGSVNGEPGKSLKVCVAGAKVGTWSDFAIGGEGGDIVDLWRAVKRQSLPEALADIRAWLGVESPRFEKQPKTWRRPERPKCTAPQGPVFDYLTNVRKLSPDAIRAYGVGERGREIVFPSKIGSELVFVKFLGIDRGADGKKAIRIEAGCEPVLFGWQAVDPNAREIVITEGEIDALTGWDYGWPALSVPFGGGKGAKQSWIENDFERLLQFEKIYLALDMDAEGEAAAEEIAGRLGRHRCRRVALPHKDLNACLQTGISAQEIRRCFQDAATLDPAELRRAGSYTDDVLRLFYPVAGEEPGYRFPLAKLRDKVRFRPGELSIWTGPTGAGKSQILSHCAVGWGSEGARLCIASLEMAPRQLLKRMVKQAGNVDRPTENYLRETMAWLDEFTWVFALTGKAKVGRLIEVFEYARSRYGCDAFVVDSLMRLGVGSEDYEGQEKAVYELVSWAIEKNVHVHLVAHARKADTKSGGGVPDVEDVKGTSEIASNAFNVFGIWRNKKLEDEIRIAAELAERGDDAAGLKLRELSNIPPVLLSVAKQRNGDWEGKCPLWFNTETYQYRGAEDFKGGRVFVPTDVDR
jgi:twinkle protein